MSCGDRYKPHVTLDLRVKNCSQRGVPYSSIDLIVVHDTESTNLAGLRDLRAIGNHFDSPVSDASAHVCTDAEGNSARYVPDHLKAWSCVWYNSRSLNIEQIGFAAQGKWSEHQLCETARWIAYWSFHYKIPIRKGTVSTDGRILKSGVVRHSELGRLGGNHSDPGSSYPLAHVNDIARGYLKHYH